MTLGTGPSGGLGGSGNPIAGNPCITFDMYATQIGAAIGASEHASHRVGVPGRAHPHDGGVLPRVAPEPDVRVLLSRAGLAGNRPVSPRAEGTRCRPRNGNGLEHLRDEVGVARLEDGVTRAFVCQQHLPVALDRLHRVRLAVLPVVGDRLIARSHLDG